MNLTPAVRTIIIACVAGFFAQLVIPGVTQWFEFVPMYVLMRPWTVVTYMFMHGGFSHIFFNLLTLFFFGPRVESRLGTNRFTTLFFLSGIAGAVLSFVFTPAAAVVGASGGIFGVMFAFAYFWPREEILIWGVLPVQAWILVAFTVLSSFWFIGMGGGGGIAHFAHLGGLVGAFLYLKLIERNAGQFRRKVQAAPKVKTDLAALRNVDRTGVHALNQEELDRILDKISATGMGSLTMQEKTFLSNFVPKDDRPPVV